jgi:hypothetical protein
MSPHHRALVNNAIHGAAKLAYKVRDIEFGRMEWEALGSEEDPMLEKIRFSGSGAAGRRCWSCPREGAPGAGLDPGTRFINCTDAV